MSAFTWGRKSVFFLVLAAAVFSVPPTASSDELIDKYGTVELLRDKWGVPHVFSESDTGAMYGLGYATAQDRGFQMHYTLRIIQGRLAEVVGNVRHVRRERDSSITSDRKMRTFGFERAAKQRVRELDKESIALLEAFSHGVNDYFDKHRQSLPTIFRQTGLVPERWKPSDCLLSWWHLAQFFATDGTRDLMAYRRLTEGPPPNRPTPQGRGGRPGAGRGAGRFPTPPAGLERVPPDESTAVVGREDVTDRWIRRTDAFLQEHGYREANDTDARPGDGGPKFSHAWVADGKYTGTDAAVLVSMPQTPVANPSLLYEFHVCGKTLNARGVGVAGSPILLIGWNQHVAWGMTALGADQADLFRLKTDDEHPDQYEFDGRWRKIKAIREEIKVRGEAARTIVVRETHLGPIVNEFAFARPNDPLVALKRVPVCDHHRDTIQGALCMMRAGTVKEFLSGLEGWRFPTANVLFGDSRGSIGYSTVGALPLRSALAPELGNVAQDGSASKFDWQAIVPQDLVPHVVNPKDGYLFSGNHRPVGSFYKIPLGIRTGSMGDSVRSWRLRQLFKGKESMTAEEILGMFQDATNPARRAIVRIGYQMRDVMKQGLSDESKLALKHLESWFAQGSPSRHDVVGTALAMLINTQFRFINTDLTFIYGGGDSGLSHCLKTINKRLDEDPKAEITPLEQEYVDRLLKGAWLTAQRRYGPDKSRWNQMALKLITQRKLAYFGSLDGFPSVDESHDMAMPPLPCVDGATVFSQAAQAYVQWVPLAEVDKARSLMPPGPSESVDDVMRTVNVNNWVKGELQPAPLSRHAVDQITVSKTLLLPQK